MIIDIQTGKEFKRVRKAERGNYEDSCFYEMTGMHAPKKTYNLGRDHLLALMEDLKIEHETLSRKMMFLESLID